MTYLQGQNVKTGRTVIVGHITLTACLSRTFFDTFQGWQSVNETKRPFDPTFFR